MQYYKYKSPDKIFGKVAVASMALAISFAYPAVATAASGSDRVGEDYPNHTITMIVPWAAGGANDIGARILTRQAAETCGYNFVVQNIAGATGAVGLGQMIRAKPDGYTIGMASGSTYLATVYGSSQLDIDKIIGITLFNRDALAMFVPADSPIKNANDLVALLKSGKRVTLASSGAGSLYELAGMGFAKAAGAPLPVNVPFKGGAPAAVAAAGHKVDFAVASVSESQSLLEAGKLRAIGIMGDAKLPSLPNTPTLKDQGIDWATYIWRGVVSSADVPANIRDKLQTCFDKVYKIDAFQDAMRKQALTAEYMNGKDYTKYMNDQVHTWSGLIDSLHLKKQ